MKGHREAGLLLKYTVAFVVFLALTVAYGCNGGGGKSGGNGDGNGGGTTNPETEFPLNEINFDAPPGYYAHFTGTGTITIEGTEYEITGSYSIEVKDEVYLESYATSATPVEALLDLTVPETNQTFTIKTTTYVADGEPLYQFIEPDNETLVPIEINPLPAVGQLGDAGDMTSWLYENGDTITGVWTLKSAAAGFINLEIAYDFKNAQDDFTGVETDTYTINEEGTIVTTDVLYHDYEDDIIVNFSADRD